MTLTQECSYCIFPSEEGVLFVAVSSRETEPFNPIVLYDGGDHALLYRNSEDVIVLDYLNPDIQNDFFETAELQIVEFDPQTHSVVRHYPAKMKQQKQLPAFGLAVTHSHAV